MFSFLANIFTLIFIVLLDILEINISNSNRMNEPIHSGPESAKTQETILHN